MSPLQVELAALRAAGDAHPFTAPVFGELRFIGASPRVVASFLAGPRAAAARRLFDRVEWFAEEADGGALGVWTPPGADPVVLRVDSEGGVQVTGRTPLDHLARHGDRATVERFCAEVGLKPPGAASAIDAPDPEALLEAGPTLAAPVRPLSRSLVGCALLDGRVLIVTGEDYGGAHGAPITHGAVFTFSPETATFTPQAPLALDGHDPAHALLLDDGSVLLICRDVDDRVQAWCRSPDGGTWAAAGAPSGLYALGTTAFSTGRSVVLTGGGNEMVAVWTEGGWADAPELDEARQRDHAVPLGDGRWLLVNGFEVPEPFWEDETSATVFLHADGTATEGPELPTDENGGGPAFRRSDGAVVAWGDDGLTVLVDDEWSELEEHPGLHPLAAVAQAGDTVWALRSEDRALVRFDLMGLTADTVATSPLPHHDALAVALADGRVLFVGGTLFDNVDCEPQLWDPTRGTFQPLPGLEEAHQQQLDALGSRGAP